MLEVFDKSRRRIAILQNALNIIEDERINAINYLNFSLPYNDPKNVFCQAFNYVRCDNGPLYRILPSTLDKSDVGLMTYQCEHVIATLIDSVMFGYHVVGNLGTYTKDVIKYILNKQTTKHWVLHECDFNRQFEYGFEQENCLGALFSIPRQFVENYMWVFDTAVYPWRISLKHLKENQIPQLYIRNKKNMLSISKQSDPKNICTRIYPLGYGEGVNQLNIASLNRNVPYIQSPKEYIDKYGIIERVWIDRRYEDQKSLLNAAEALLKELQEPTIEYTIGFQEVGIGQYDKAAIGKLCKIIDTDAKEEYITFITGITKNYDDLSSSTLTIANTPKDIASTIAELADRQRIEMTYSQGATQLYSQSLQANADKNNGAVIKFHIPSEMRIINKIAAKISLSSFRAYSRATEGGGATTETSSSGGGGTKTSSSGGGGTKTSSSGGGGTKTSSSAGKLSRSTDASGGSIETSEVDRFYSGSDGHNHGIDEGVKLALFDGSVIVEGEPVLKKSTENGGYYTWRESGQHKHSFEFPRHYHEFSTPAHTHDVSIPSHTHDISIPNHTHDISLPSHAHTISIPNHNHTIDPGIYFFGYPKSFNLIVNGVDRGIFYTTDTEIDLTKHLLDSSNRIPRGGWQSVEIRPNDLAYISIDMFVQGFVQSRGDYTY